MIGLAGNVKITRPEDLPVARGAARAAGRPMTGTRVGLGFDVHPSREAGRSSWGAWRSPLSGAWRAFDADALTHAVADALLGALALGDLGRHFPDTDPGGRRISSQRLLGEVAQRVRAAGGAVVNVDATVVAEGPRLAGRLDAMQAQPAATLGVALDRVSVKAKRAEGLGALGGTRASRRWPWRSWRFAVGDGCTGLYGPGGGPGGERSDFSSTRIVVGKEARRERAAGAVRALAPAAPRPGGTARRAGADLFATGPRRRTGWRTRWSRSCAGSPGDGPANLQPHRHVLVLTRAVLADTPELDAGGAALALTRACRASGLGRRVVEQVVRLALTGRSQGPDLAGLVAVLGRDEVVRRLDHARAAVIRKLA